MLRPAKDSIAALERAGQKLVIHFDINNTILMKDSTSGHDSLDGTFNETLSKCALGVAVTCLGAPFWCAHTTSPFLQRGVPDEVSWYEFQRKLCPNDAALKAAAAQFVAGDGRHLSRHLDAMHAQGESIFQSFYTTIGVFEDATIVFRSFGKDIPYVANELKRNGFLVANDAFQVFASQHGSLVGAEGHSSTPLEFARDTLASCKQRFVAVQEDYDWWRIQGKLAKFGKLVHGAPGVFQVGFDDLDCMDAVGEGVRVHKISTFEALTDPYFFVRHIVADIWDTLSNRDNERQ